MAFRNSSGQPNAGSMIGPQGQQQQQQQQQPRPGNAQFVQQRVSYPEMAPQRYPVIPQQQQQQQQQQTVFPTQIYQPVVNLQQQPRNYLQPQQQQQFTGQAQHVPIQVQQPTAQQQIQQQKFAEQQKKLKEQSKKDRYYQEQQRKLKQFNKRSGKAASGESLNINLDEVFGTGSRKDAATRGTPEQPQSVPLPDDGFGDYLQAPTLPSGQSNGSQSYVISEESQTSAHDEGFGDFKQGAVDDAKTLSQEPRESTAVEKVKKEKKTITLESMMLDSTDLSAPSKPNKHFHHRKPMVESPSNVLSAAQYHQTFTGQAGNPSKPSTGLLFNMREMPELSAGGPTGQSLDGGVTSLGPTGGVVTNSVPAWCLDESSLPVVYRQVLEASLQNGVIETSLLYPILMLSGLEKLVLGRIWELANQTIPGQLTRLELNMALGMIALVQNGQIPSLEALHQYRTAPLPMLTPKEKSDAQGIQLTTGLSTSSPIGVENEDKFSPFQEALKSPKAILAAKSRQESKPTNSYSSWGSSISTTSTKHKRMLSDEMDRDIKMDSKFPKEDRTPGDDDDDDDDDDDTDDDEFHDFQSAPQHAEPSKQSSSLVSFPPIAPPSRPAATSAASAKQTKFATSGMHSFDSKHRRSPHTPESADQQKIDLFQMDFDKVFPKVGRKFTSTDDFANFQASSGAVPNKATDTDDEFGEFAQFKHSASESDLIGMQPATTDKYAVFRDLVGSSNRPTSILGALTNDDEDDFDDFKQANEEESATTPVPTTLSSDPSVDFTAASANFEEPFPPNHSTQTLPAINLSQSLPDNNEDEFADFQHAEPANPPNNLFNPKSDSISTSSSDDKYGVLRCLASADDLLEDEFGDFKNNSQRSVLDSLKSTDEAILEGLKKPLSASDLYGMEFDAMGSANSPNEPVNMLNLDDVPDNEPPDLFDATPTSNPYSPTGNAFQSSQQQSELAKLDSIHRLDLKTFDLDLTLGTPTVEKKRGDSFGEFSSAPVAGMENGGQDLQNNARLGVSGTLALSPGVSTVPLVPTGSSVLADRYSEVVGDVDNENQHANEWQRCLATCYEAIKKANNVFNNISSSLVCSEVIKSSEGAEYLTAVIEVYRVACRIITSMNAIGVDSAELQRLQKDIELVWNNLSAFLASSTLMPATGSFVFKTAILRPEPTNTDQACGVCLLNVDSRSKAFDRSLDSHKLVYGGRQYHSTCANLWVNMVDSILPALPFNKLL